MRLRDVRNIGAQCRRFETAAAAAAHPRHHVGLSDLAKPPAALGQPRRRVETATYTRLPTSRAVTRLPSRMTW